MFYYDLNQFDSFSLDNDIEINQTQNLIVSISHKDNTNEYIEEDFLKIKEKQEKSISRISGEKTKDKTITKIDENNIEEIINNKLIKKVKAIFKIVKIKKKNTRRGRIPYKLKKYFSGLHTRNDEDNIIKKIKRSFIDKVRAFINKKYEIYLDNTNTKLIKRISSKEILKTKKEQNLAFFDMTLKELFSSTISSKYKYSLCNKNDNKSQIDKLYKEKKAIEIINILDMTVREIYKIYSFNIKRKGFEELRNLKYDLLIREKELRFKNEKNIKDYLDLYEKIAINLEDIIKGKKPRRRYRK